MKIGPCKGCETRHKCCWQSCERYQGWKAEVDKEAAYNREFRKMQGEIFEALALPILRKRWALQKCGRGAY